MRLYLTALNPTDAVVEGFIPAAVRLGLPVTLLTDQPASWPPVVADLVGCDPRDYRAIIESVQDGDRPAAVLSNSNHLQAATALAAEYLDLPGKDWRVGLRCQDKRLTRRTIAEAGLDTVAAVSIGPADDPRLATKELPFPAVVKPCDGTASEDVFLVAEANELVTRVEQIRQRRPEVSLVAEEYLPGELHTFDTLGDDTEYQMVGSWHTSLGSPPTFIEEAHDWAPMLPAPVVADVRAQLDALGVGFGACHAEFVIWDGGARLIEVNDRLIGDRMDLILADLLDLPVFEYVIRLYLGQLLSSFALPDPTNLGRYARVEYVCADQSGTLTAAPGAVDLNVDGVRLGSRPLRAVGVRSDLTVTNRDYLAVLHAIGTTPAAVTAALLDFRATYHWEITA